MYLQKPETSSLVLKILLIKTPSISKILKINNTAVCVFASSLLIYKGAERMRGNAR